MKISVHKYGMILMLNGRIEVDLVGRQHIHYILNASYVDISAMYTPQICEQTGDCPSLSCG